MKNTTFKRLGLIASFLGATATLAMVLPAYLGIPEIRPLFGLPLQAVNPTQTPVPPKTEDPPQTDSKKKDGGKPNPSAQISIDGQWRSGTSGNVYHFVSRNSEKFDIYIDDPNPRKIQKVGDGTCRSRSVQASLIVLEVRRKARLKLTLSEDGQTLEGTFVGTDLHEIGYLIFRKLSDSDPAMIEARLKF